MQRALVPQTTKCYFVVFEIRRTLGDVIEFKPDEPLRGTTFGVNDEVYDDIAFTLLMPGMKIRVRTHFLEFWAGMSKIRNVYPLIWSCMGFTRAKAACDFLFRTCPVKPGKIFSALDVTRMVDRSGKEYRMPITEGNKTRDGPAYVLKDLRKTLWSNAHRYSFHPSPPPDVSPNHSNTLLVDPRREVCVMYPDHALYPTAWTSPESRHSCLERNILPFVSKLAESGTDVPDFVKANRGLVSDMCPLPPGAHVNVSLRRWRIDRKRLK